ncbi:MAG: hypothetical protein AB7U76_25035 [Pirellulales bacterium]
MPDLLFGEYRPDANDRNQEHTRTLSNVLPQSDGYGPVKAFQAYTEALAAQCRGFFYARNADRSVSVFAGTATKLYRLDKTTLTWVDVSASSGTYSSLDDDANWSFCQFNNFVFATQRNAVVQVYNLASSTEFATLAGSPPQAGSIAVVGRFLVLCNLLSSAYRIQWSALNNTTKWTPGTDFSDFQDLPSGGVPLKIIGGELGIILQESEIRRMIYQPGSDLVFQIDRVAEQVGIAHPDSVTAAGNMIYCYSTRGFIGINASGEITNIGEERVNRTFQQTADLDRPQYIIGVSDPLSSTILFTYPMASASTSGFDAALVFNYVLNKWSPVTIEGEYVASLSRPGLTLENMDALAPGALTITGAADNGSGKIRITVAHTSSLTTGDYKTISGVAGTTEANGTWAITVINGTTFDLDGSTFANTYTSGGVVGGSMDDMTFSFDAVSLAPLPRLCWCDTTHALGFLSGLPLEATLTTATSELDRGKRIDINNLRPITDAVDAYAAVVMQERRDAVASVSAETAMDSDGNCFVIENTRYAAARVRIPAGTDWSYVSGVTPEFRQGGRF